MMIFKLKELIRVNNYETMYLLNCLVDSCHPTFVIVYPQRSCLLVSCFNIRVQVVLDVEISCRVGVCADQHSSIWLQQHFLDGLRQSVGLARPKRPYKTIIYYQFPQTLLNLKCNNLMYASSLSWQVNYVKQTLRTYYQNGRQRYVDLSCDGHHSFFLLQIEFGIQSVTPLPAKKKSTMQFSVFYNFILYLI